MKRPTQSNEERKSSPGQPADSAGLKPGITVIIPTFNRQQLLKRAIESVLNQTVKADQIIVVDDGSTDGTPEMCRRFSGSIEYVRQSNAGVAEARNHGIRLARHAWIAFLDSDDYWMPAHLQSVTAAIEATGGQARFYFSNVYLVNGTQNTTLWSQIGLKFDGPFLQLPDGADWMLSNRQPASIQSSVFNSAVLKASGGFDRRTVPMEDTELFCRLGIGGCVCAVNAIGCFYSADDNTKERLTVKVNPATEKFWKCKRTVWSLVHCRFPNLDPSHRRIIRYRLADACWRLARTCWRSGKIFQGFRAFLQCLKARPSLPLSLLRPKTDGSQEPVSHAAPERKQCPPQNCEAVHPE